MTSAVRDAANGGEFAAAVRERYGLDARTLSGDEEARLTFRGATAARTPAPGERLLVIDIGGGSTELVIGERGDVAFHVSTQVGVVRHSERHLHSDPPTPRGAATRSAPTPAPRSPRPSRTPSATGSRRPSRWRAPRPSAPASTSATRPTDVEGHRLSLPALEAMLERLAALPLDRAPRGPRARPRPGADDRRRRGRPDPHAGRVRPRRRSRCPIATSSGAQRSSWHRPARPTPYPPYGGFLDVCSIVSAGQTRRESRSQHGRSCLPPSSADA